MKKNITENIIEVEVSEETKKDFLRYAKEVIEERAIPDVRDGLKDVARKTLYIMKDIGLHHKAQKRKVSMVAGQVMRLSTHGDTGIHGAMFLAGQDYRMYIPTIEGQGNFGSIDGSSHAAARYPECRLSHYSDLILLDGLTSKSVDWEWNFDNTEMQPVVLPAKLPNILINGTPLGIAVGYSCVLPPHNPKEVIDACVAFVKDRYISLESIMSYIKAPDFPTGGVINGIETVKNAYRTGSGSVLIRGKYKLEEYKGYPVIDIYEIPYLTSTVKIVEQINALAIAGEISLKESVTDLTDGLGIKIELILKKDEDIERVINTLFKKTYMEYRVPMISYVLLNKEIKLMTLLDMIREFVQFREITIYNQKLEELEKKQDRMHLIDGIFIINKELDKAIQMVKNSKDKADAKLKLIKHFKLSDKQAEYIVMLRIYRITNMSIKEFKDEYEQLKKDAKALMKITRSKSNSDIDAIMTDEWLELKSGFFKDFKRKTTIQSEFESIKISDTIKDTPCNIYLTKEGYLKKVYGNSPISYGSLDMSNFTEDEAISFAIQSSDTKTLIILTNYGRVFNLKCYNIEDNKRGKLIRNIISNFKDDESVIALFNNDDIIKNITTLTSSGMVKNTPLKELSGIGPSGKIVHKLVNNDILVSAEGNMDSSVIITKSGQILRTNLSNVRATGIGGSGVVGIKLKPKDEAVSMCSIGSKFITILSRNGMLKNIDITDITEQARGGYGLIAHNVNAKSGQLIQVMNDLGSSVIVNITNSQIPINLLKYKADKRTGKGTYICNDIQFAKKEN